MSPGESVLIEPGHLIYKDMSSKLDVRSGGLRGMFSHMLAGSDVFLLKVDGPGEIGPAGFLPGKIVKIDMNNNVIIAEFNSFLCMDSTINYSTKFAGMWQGIFGGEGLFLYQFLKGYISNGEEINVELSHVLYQFLKGYISNKGITKLYLSIFLFIDKNLININMIKNLFKY